MIDPSSLGECTISKVITRHGVEEKVFFSVKWIDCASLVWRKLELSVLITRKSGQIDVPGKQKK